MIFLHFSRVFVSLGQNCKVVKFLLIQTAFQRGEYTKRGSHHLGEGGASGISCVRGNDPTLVLVKWLLDLGHNYAQGLALNQNTAQYSSLWKSPLGREGLLFPCPYLEASLGRTGKCGDSVFAVSYPRGISVFLLSSNTWINLCQKET